MQPPTRYSQARIPTTHGAFRLVVYRLDGRLDGRADGADCAVDIRAAAVGDGAREPDEHVAMVYGEVKGADDVLCRVHSACFTGEVLGSLRCDCREQLDHALARIAAEGRGVLVYLRQEGRGIGLGNKVRAYALQDGGADTVDANLALGFEADLRSYEVAAGILSDLGVRSVRLMTNNPGKIEGLERAGIEVSSHESHWVGASEHSAAYLQVKQERMGHIADDGPHGGDGGDGAGDGAHLDNPHEEGAATP